MATSRETSPPVEPRARICAAPEPFTPIHGRSVFLAGSIERNVEDGWRAQVIRRLRHLPITILNPRRDDWDKTWVERRSDPRFLHQAEWELDGQARADIVVLYLHPDTQAPISLLELGLNVRKPGKVVVCCPDGFWCKGNVDVVCRRFGVTVVETLEELMVEVEERLRG